MSDPYYTNKSIRDVPPSIQTDAMSKRLSSVLDSLAAVLVSQETKEVISVGVRLGPTNEIVLSIADNKPVGPNIKTHALDVWHRLIKLSEGFGDYQKKHEMKRDQSDTSTSPPMIRLTNFSENLQSEICDFKYSIYFHHFRKFMNRFTKGKPLYARYEGIEALRDKLKEKETPSIMEQGLLSSMNRLVAVLAIVHSLVKSGQFPISTEDFDTFSCALEVATETVRAILSDENSVSYLEKDDHISLRYMKKVTSVTQSINILIKAAYSPRVRARFFSGKKLDVELVTSSTQILNFPQNKEDYRQLAGSVLFSLGDRLQGDEGVPPSHIMNNPLRKIAVHTECILLLHLIKCSQDNKSVHCLPFIGCSKLSCLSCFFFFESVRVVMGVNFQVGGSHGKIYPWVFPETALQKINGNAAQQVQIHFTGKVKGRYLEVVRQKRAGRKSSPTPSDSSTNSAVEDSAAELLRDLGYEIP